MELKPGIRLRSVACEGEFIVIRAPSGDLVVECGGHAVVPIEDPAPAVEIDPAQADGVMVGKRYGHEDLQLELLCTKTGLGSLAVDGVLLTPRQAKPLPSSD